MHHSSASARVYGAVGFRSQDATGPQQRERVLMYVRLSWIVLVLFVLGVFIASLPVYSVYLRTICTGHVCANADQLTPAGVRLLKEAGLSVDFYANYMLTAIVLFAFVWVVIGIVILRYKPNEWMALFASFTLIAFGVTFNRATLTVLVKANPAWQLPVSGIEFIGAVGFALFFYLFPDGRFVPRWMRWLMLIVILLAVQGYFFPGISSVPWFSTLINLVFVGLVGSFIFAQVYRYQRISSSAQRRQTRWVVYGLSIALPGFIGVIYLLPLVFPKLSEPGPFVNLVTGTVAYLFMLLNPLSIGIAMVRSRLFDIDVLINRTLVYAILTGMLALVYVICIILLQQGFHTLTEQDSDLAIIGSTLAIAALFQPLRGRIQILIDRRFYRDKYDAKHTVTTFSATLRGELDLAQLSKQLVTVIEETMQPTRVSLWLRYPKREETEALQPLPSLQSTEAIKQRQEEDSTIDVPRNVSRND